MLPNYVDNLLPLREPAPAQEFGPEFRHLRLELPEEGRALRRETVALGVLLALLAVAAWIVSAAA